jgi:hypothetical protein
MRHLCSSKNGGFGNLAAFRGGVIVEEPDVVSFKQQQQHVPSHAIQPNTLPKNQNYNSNQPWLRNNNSDSQRDSRYSSQTESSSTYVQQNHEGGFSSSQPTTAYDFTSPQMQPAHNSSHPSFTYPAQTRQQDLQQQAYQAYEQLRQQQQYGFVKDSSNHYGQPYQDDSEVGDKRPEKKRKTRWD